AGDGGPTCVRVWWTRHAFSVRLACYRGRDPSGEFWRSARWPGRWQAGAGSEPGPEVLDGAPQPFVWVHSRLIAQPGPGQGEIRPSHLRVVRRPVHVHDSGTAARQRDAPFRQLPDGDLMLGAAVDRPRFSGVQ